MYVLGVVACLFFSGFAASPAQTAEFTSLLSEIGTSVNQSAISQSAISTQLLFRLHGYVMLNIVMVSRLCVLFCFAP